MKAANKDQNAHKQTGKANAAKGQTVRGSGFTYTEEKARTDKSIPAEKVDNEEIVTLPDLGKKNRS